jgi:hypothetical protein
MAELAPNEVIASLRRPAVIFTENYLNDPVKFDPDERFEPESTLRELRKIAIAERDSVGYALVDINKREPQWYPKMMYRLVHSQPDVTRTIDKEFSELI